MPRPIAITLEQEHFCRLYLSDDKDLFGTGTQSMIRACYDDLWAQVEGKEQEKLRKTARERACRWLKNPRVLARLAQLMELTGFNDVNVDKQHLFLINQCANLPVKLGAITQYNKLQGRVKDGLEIPDGVNVNIVNFGSKKQKEEEGGDEGQEVIKEARA